MGAGWQRWWREPPKFPEPKEPEIHPNHVVISSGRFLDGTRYVFYACGCRIFYAPGSVAYSDGVDSSCAPSYSGAL